MKLRWRGRLNWKDIAERVISGVITVLLVYALLRIA